MVRQSSKKTRQSKNNFIRYSSLGFEMCFIIGAGVWSGIKLDALLGKEKLFTALLSLAGVIIAIYFAIKEFIKPPNENK